MGLGWPMLVAGEALWSGSPLTRVPFATRSPELLFTPPSSAAFGRLEFVNDTRLVLVNPHGAWVVDLGSMPRSGAATQSTR
jgi:hypothetical protein